MNTHTPEDASRTCLNCQSHVSGEFARVCGDEQGHVHRCPNCWPNALGAVAGGVDDSVHVTRSEFDPEEVDTEVTLDWTEYHSHAQSYDGSITAPDDLSPRPRPDSDADDDADVEGMVEVDVDPDLEPDEQLDQILDAVLGPAE